MVMSLSATGDLAELQQEFSERLAGGTARGFPIQAPGDVVYETELGQSNFYHVFGAELNDHMRAITGRRQHWWVEGIRCPDEEFPSREAEQANYHRVLEANGRKRDRIWDAADYREFHTVAAFRSPLDPAKR
jgi:chloramphenicol 3-O-phosphotransferase